MHRARARGRGHDREGFHAGLFHYFRGHRRRGQEHARGGLCGLAACTGRDRGAQPRTGRQPAGRAAARAAADRGDAAADRGAAGLCGPQRPSAHADSAGACRRPMGGLRPFHRFDLCLPGRGLGRGHGLAVPAGGAGPGRAAAGADLSLRSASRRGGSAACRRAQCRPLRGPGAGLLRARAPCLPGAGVRRPGALLRAGCHGHARADRSLAAG